MIPLHASLPPEEIERLLRASHARAEAIVSSPHPSERGVEKLPADAVLGLFAEAAEQMRRARGDR